MMIWINRSFEVGLIVSVWLLLGLVLVIFNFDNASINLNFLRILEKGGRKWVKDVLDA